MNILEKKQILQTIKDWQDYSQYSTFSLEKEEQKLNQFIVGQVLPFLGQDINFLKKLCQSNFSTTTLKNLNKDQVWLLCHELHLLARNQPNLGEKNESRIKKNSIQVKRSRQTN